MKTPAVREDPVNISRMQRQLNVKGSTLRSKLEFTEERFGSTARQQIEEYLREQGFPTILDANWYPFDLFDGVLQKMADDFFDGDLTKLEEVGAYSAEQALSTTYEPYAARRDFQQFLQRISSLHDRFYDTGQLEITARGDEFCEIELQGLPQVSQADVHVAAGFYVGAARFMGLESARCRFSIGPDRVHFRLDWS